MAGATVKNRWQQLVKFRNQASRRGQILSDLVRDEYLRQSNTIQLIASENLPSPNVYQILKYPFLQWKTAEGQPGDRFHSGCAVVDRIEALASESANALFHSAYANVQPVTATAANHAVLRALATTEEAILSLDIRGGGHVSHNMVWPNVHHYTLSESDRLLDFDIIRNAAKKVRPRIIIAGASSYPRIIRFDLFREIADEFDALLVADCAHIAGLVAAGLHPSPIDFAHVTTGSTYKTLRGPRSGFILLGRDHEMRLGSKPLFEIIDRAVFPGVQSSPEMLLITAKAACFIESNTLSFVQYASQIVENARSLAASLADLGFDVVTKGTDTHVVLVDLSNYRLSGLAAERALELAGILTNRNLVPFDPLRPQIASGIRFGTAFVTSRGFGTSEMSVVAKLIHQIISKTTELSLGRISVEDEALSKVKDVVLDLTCRYPIFSSARTTGFELVHNPDWGDLWSLP